MHIYLKFESYNLQSKNLVHKGVDFYVQNVLRASLIPTIFPCYTPGPPLKGEGGSGEGLLERIDVPTNTFRERFIF